MIKSVIALILFSQPALADRVHYVMHERPSAFKTAKVIERQEAGRSVASAANTDSKLKIFLREELKKKRNKRSEAKKR